MLFSRDKLYWQLSAVSLSFHVTGTIFPSRSAVVSLCFWGSLDMTSFSIWAAETKAKHDVSAVSQEDEGKSGPPQKKNQERDKGEALCKWVVIHWVEHVVVTLSIFKTGHLNPTPAVLVTGRVRLRWHLDVAPTHTSTKSKALLDLLCIFTHTQHDNGYDICIYVKLASPFSAGQAPIIPARWADRQPVRRWAHSSRGDEREYLTPGAFTLLSHSLLPSFISQPPLAFPYSSIFNNGGMHACIRALILWGHRVAVKNGCCLFTPPAQGPQAVHF